MTATHLSCSNANVEDALNQAEMICRENSAKLTPIRRRVLELLLKADAPSKAYDLLADLNDDSAPAKPPTVYRALDFLLELGLAHKIESLNAYVACGHTGHGHSAAFLICEKCENADELHADTTFSTLNKETENVSFKLNSAVIEVRGVCKNCQ